jgi:DNA polymerase V
MQDVGIFDGDVLIVERHETARNGDNIVNFNGEFVCNPGILDVDSQINCSSSDLI